MQYLNSNKKGFLKRQRGKEYIAWVINMARRANGTDMWVYRDKAIVKLKHTAYIIQAPFKQSGSLDLESIKGSLKKRVHYIAGSTIFFLDGTQITVSPAKSRPPSVQYVKHYDQYKAFVPLMPNIKWDTRVRREGHQQFHSVINRQKMCTFLRGLVIWYKKYIMPENLSMYWNAYTASMFMSNKLDSKVFLSRYGLAMGNGKTTIHFPPQKNLNPAFVQIPYVFKNIDKLPVFTTIPLATLNDIKEIWDKQAKYAKPQLHINFDESGNIVGYSFQYKKNKITHGKKGTMCWGIRNHDTLCLLCKFHTEDIKIKIIPKTHAVITECKEYATLCGQLHNPDTINFHTLATHLYNSNTKKKK